MPTVWILDICCYFLRTGYSVTFPFISVTCSYILTYVQVIYTGNVASQARLFYAVTELNTRESRKEELFLESCWSNSVKSSSSLRDSCVFSSPNCVQEPLVRLRGTDYLGEYVTYIWGTDYPGEYVIARDFQVPAAQIYISEWDFRNGTLSYISRCLQWGIN